ncbi:MAG TPA: carboxyl transferase domain-containing protein, partial [Ramlibacter sp.]|nr:carboxyl transferase domain-containing protein [Ramlibacter sp.]
MKFRAAWDAQGAAARQRRAAMLARLEQLRALEQRAADKSAEARPVFEKRGQLLPRERVGLLLDPGAPWLPLCSLAGYLQDQKDPLGSVPGGGMIAGIGFVRGVRCMVVASDSGIDAGAIQPMGLEKILRVQEIALREKLPFVHLVESAGANLMRYRVEGFVQGGALFRNLARLSAAGIPVITVQHGSGTAGGAYMPGLSDVVIMVRKRSRAFLAGPPLLKAATGEIASEEELGGAEMHTAVSGLGEYLAEDDRHALGVAREVVGSLSSRRMPECTVGPASSWIAGRARNDKEKEDLLTLMPGNLREPVDMREIMVRLVDDADLLEFKPLYGAATVCAQGRIAGHAVGFVGNNGPIDVPGANKATHFIQWMCQVGHPIVYLQNTTGYMVGKQSEQDGMIKHGSKMIQAVTNATVPQLTIQCGASFGAGNYGMCGRGYAPRFLFSWPSAKTAVMGGEQAARTMQIVSEAALARKGMAPDPAQSQAQFDKIVAHFEAQADAF